jgi:hypothetical protein
VLTLFQDLTLFFDIKDHPELQFPKTVGSILPLEPAKLQNYAVMEFFGLGNNGKGYHLNGYLYAMPPQQGIPGFQRVTMIKYLPKDGQGYDDEGCWVYEGCVLPGSNIILGRWWSPLDIDFSGPFIYWLVNECPEDSLKTVDTAVKFLEDMEWDSHISN